MLERFDDERLQMTIQPKNNIYACPSPALRTRFRQSIRTRLPNSVRKAPD